MKNKDNNLLRVIKETKTAGNLRFLLLKILMSFCFRWKRLRRLIDVINGKIFLKYLIILKTLHP